MTPNRFVKYGHDSTRHPDGFPTRILCKIKKVGGFKPRNTNKSKFQQSLLPEVISSTGCTETRC